MITAENLTLFHDINAGAAGCRNLLILYVLFCGDIEPEIAAELATYLMYSAALTTPMAANLYRCIDKIYATYTEKDPTPSVMGGRWEAAFPSNWSGSGKQFAYVVERNIEILMSQLKIENAMRKMKRVMQEPEMEDFFDRIATPLQAAHRVSIEHYRKTGVPLPFKMDTAPFNQPDRTMFGAKGQWLLKVSANAIFGWDIPAVRSSGLTHGALTGDLYGCLFFHVKDELLKFSIRARKYNLSITVFTGVSKVDKLPKFICDGNLQPFEEGCFDRINLAELVDEPDESHPEQIKTWAPMLNKKNPYAAMLLYFREWETKTSYSSTSNTPPELNASNFFIECGNAFGIDLKTIAGKGTAYSPEYIFLLDSLDAFYDNEPAFGVYLRKIKIRQIAGSVGLKMREQHRIYPKRYGIPLDNSDSEAKIPKLTREEFYDLFTLGGAFSTMGFLPEIGTA